MQEFDQAKHPMSINLLKFADLKGVFAQEQTSRGLLVIGLDADGRRVEVLFQITSEPKANWEAISVRYL